MNNEAFQMEYRYIGDRQTALENKGRLCRAQRRPDGKCIRGTNGSMLVVWENGQRCIVIGRLLRRLASGSGN